MRGFHTRSLSISSFRKCEFLLHNWSQQIRAIKSLCCGFCKIHNKICRYKKSFKNLKKNWRSCGKGSLVLRREAGAGTRDASAQVWQERKPVVVCFCFVFVTLSVVGIRCRKCSPKSAQFAVSLSVFSARCSLLGRWLSQLGRNLCIYKGSNNILVGIIIIKTILLCVNIAGTYLQ